LKYDEAILKNNESLKSYGMKNGSVVDDYSDYAGWLEKSPDVEKELDNKICKFNDKNAQSFQTCIDGLNLLGICHNPKCIANE